MEWMEILVLFLFNTGLIIWFRAESRADWRHIDNKIQKIRIENDETIKSIRQDIKDFHARLCAIEERNKK